MKLNLYLARAGVASRRRSAELVKSGRAAVDGKTVLQPSFEVEPGQAVTLDGRPLQPETRRYLALNKPAGYTCTLRDPFASSKVTALVPAELGRLYPVGRLDRESTGLVILTNDGDLAERLTHPRYGVEKEYRVVVAPPVEPGDLARLRSGVFDEGERLRAAGARLTGPAAGGKSELSLILKEGRKREIRRLFAQLGRRVIELERVRIGTVRLGRLPAGRWRSLTPAELAGLGAGRE